jgi:diguanylate cyclase (GGDEF)-like protein
MSFRSRLTLFFVVIVVIPMIAATVVVLKLLSSSERQTADARLAEGQTAAIGLYQREIDRASTAAVRAGSDPLLAQALRNRDRAAATARAQELLQRLKARRLAITRFGRTFVDVGARNAAAPATRQLVARSGRSVGRLQASVITAPAYAALTREVTRLHVVVRRNDKTLHTSLAGIPSKELSDVGTLAVGRREFRIASFTGPGFGESTLQVSVMAERGLPGGALAASRVVAGVALAGFLILAFGFAIAVSRSLQGQIGRFLAGARRLASGDFSTEVSIEGNDEFAALGQEFNKMSRQLETRLEELRQERARLEDSIRRIGETLGSALDRDGLLEILVRTAVDAVGADCGRATARNGSDTALRQRTSAGELAGFGEAIQAAELLAQESGSPEETTHDGRSAMAFPLSSEPDEVSALVSVARAGRPFTKRDRDLFNYLARQAAVSLENVDLHELVQRQAVTDELTGLYNHRRFQEVITSEVERAKRFGHSLGLIMLDIDDFKQVNDTFGHQQGDRVLREIGRVLRESSREIDLPARYGGEELAVALPETDLDGAYNLAERIRASIAELEIPRADGRGTLPVTASFGVAALPESAAARRSLIGAADAALYRAKRAGKNRTERAEPSPPAKAPLGRL